MTVIHTHGWRIFASICTHTCMYGAYITSKHKPLGRFTSNHSLVSCMKPSSKHKHRYTIGLGKNIYGVGYNDFNNLVMQTL